MNHFQSMSGVGVWQTFFVMAAIYFVFMMAGASAIAFRRPAGSPKAGSPRFPPGRPR